MREIKFRAWDEGCKLMWKHAYILCDSIECAGLNNNDKAATSDNEDRFILMQYTGLKDKNGKEIYEGDIVKVDFWEFKNHKRIKYYERGVIKWFDWKCGWMLETGKDRFIDLFIGEFHFEVIGNIYENKELLKKE